MSRFSMTKPEPSPADHVFPAQPGIDYAERVELAWLEAQIAAVEIDDFAAEASLLLTRCANGERWLRDHDAQERGYRRAQRLLFQLRDELGAIEIQRWTAMRRCWLGCCIAYAAMQHVTTPINDYGVPITPVMCAGDPGAFWTVLRGDEPAPDTWPPSKHYWDVTDGDVVPPWMRADLERRLGQIRKALAA